MSDLQVLESPREQASDEIIAWTFNWSGRLNGLAIASCVGKITQINNGEDETARCLGAQPVINGEFVSIVVQSLTVGKRYRVTSHCTLSDSTVQDADLILEVPH